MARYVDAKDLRALVPDSFRDAALADSAGGDEADAGLLAAVLESSCDEVDALIEGRVRLPLATVPRKLRVAAAHIALEMLFLRRGLNLREDAAAKVQWWRNWLSKVGEGELRLDAPPPDGAGTASGHASSVAVRPAVTGTHGLMFGLLLAFSLFALVPAETSRAVEARTWAFDLPAAADVFDNPAEMEWAAGESLVLSYTGGALSAGQTARWEVASGTNLWLALGPDAAGSPWTWSLAPTQTCLPSGRYAGRIAVYETDGTEATFARVAALQSIRVHQGAAGLATANPLAVLSDYAHLSWAEAQHSAIARDIATNAAAIADLEAAATETAAGVATNAAAIADLGTAVGGLEASLGGYLAKTNGEWVAVQSGLWHGLKWAGAELFGAALLVETNQARITGLRMGSNGTAVITFLGSATTNRLQATTNATDWATWNDCSWSYNGRTGTVTVANAAPGTFWRILAVDGVPDRTNAVLVAYAPFYVGNASSPANLVATRADVVAIAASLPATSAGGLAPVGWEDNFNPSPTNLLWAISHTNDPYFSRLAVGGWEYAEQVVEGGVTQTVIRTQTGTLSLNGVAITSWADIVAGYASQDWARQWVAAYVATNHQSLDGYATLADLEGIAADVDLSGVWDGIRAVSNAIPSTNALASREWTAAYVATNHQSLAGYATTAYVTDYVGGLSNMIAGITGGGEVDLSGVSAQLAALRQDVDAAAGGVGTNAAAVAGLRDATNALDTAVGALQDGLGGYLAKTNGEWVAVQSGLWHGLTWAGSELFGAALLVETNQARITGLQTGSGNTAVITFLGSATTNRLQATTNATDWTTWNDCSWSYSGRTGTVTVANAAPGTFWRILAVDGVPDRTNAVLVAYAPLYVGDPSAPENRVATLGDLPAAVERQVQTRARSAATVTRTAWEDAMNLPPVVPAWNFSTTGTYFNALTVGGARYTIETNGASTTYQQTGRLTLNGESITSWAQLAAYAEGAEIVPGVATLNGQRGDLSIEAGDNVTITDTDGTLVISSEGGGVTALNSMQGSVTIVGGAGISVSTASGADNLLIVSATGGGGGGGTATVDTNALVAAAIAAVQTNNFQSLTLGGVERNSWPTGGSAWTPSSRIVTVTNATVLASDMLIWMDSEAAEDDQTIFLPDMATESQTVVIRHLGSDHPTTIVRATPTATNTYQLTGDGASIAVDWLGAKNTWYWRQAY